MQMTAGRKLRDAGFVQVGKNACVEIGMLSPEQAEIARLRRHVGGESQLKRSEAAVGVMGKLHEYLESLSEDTNDEPTCKSPGGWQICLDDTGVPRNEAMRSDAHGAARFGFHDVANLHTT